MKLALFLIIILKLATKKKIILIDLITLFIIFLKNYLIICDKT